MGFVFAKKLKLKPGRRAERRAAATTILQRLYHYTLVPLHTGSPQAERRRWLLEILISDQFLDTCQSSYSQQAQFPDQSLWAAQSASWTICPQFLWAMAQGGCCPTFLLLVRWLWAVRWLWFRFFLRFGFLLPQLHKDKCLFEFIFALSFWQNSLCLVWCGISTLSNSGQAAPSSSFEHNCLLRYTG